MEFIYPLCSSSKGNCIFLGNAQKGVLIDAGIGIRNFAKQIKLSGINPKAIKAICITHEHSDHINGLFKIQQALKVPIIATKDTIKALIEKEAIAYLRLLEIIDTTPKNVGDIVIEAIYTPHDSAESCGYKIRLNDKRMAVCTDLGHITQQIHNSLCDCDFVLLESNYEQNMLDFGKYPQYLKRRINSDVGHLSNVDCSVEIGKLYKAGVKNFMLGHLSEENNMPQLAMSHTVSVLTALGGVINENYTLHVAPKLNNGNTVIRL